MKLAKKLVLLIILLIPFNCFAIGYEFGEPMDGETGKGVKFIHIKVTGATDESLKTDKLICSVDSEDATCIIEPLIGYKIEEGAISTDSGEALKNESVARIVITNSTETKVNTKVTLIYGDGLSIEKEKVEIAGKEPPKSSDSSLKTLTYNVGTLFPEFSGDQNNYTLYNIGDTYPRVKFAYTCDKCQVKFEGGTATSGSNVSIQKGENQVKIIVTSQDGNNTTTYYLNVIQGTTTFNSNKLKSIKLEDYAITPSFTADTLEYEVTVPKKVTNIENTLKVETEDPKATTSMEGAGKLDADDNTVKITVTGQDGNKTEYILKVHRENTQEEIIEVIFYKDKKVAFINTENEPVSEPVETPTEEKEENSKGKFPWIIVIIILVAVIIIVVAGIIIFKEPKNKDDEPKVPTEDEKKQLDDIDTYNEEARLIAANNIEAKTEEIQEETMEQTNIIETVEETPTTVEPTEETIIREETNGEYVNEEKTPTMDIDEALSDLMNTQEYNFKDK